MSLMRVGGVATTVDVAAYRVSDSFILTREPWRDLAFSTLSKENFGRFSRF